MRNRLITGFIALSILLIFATACSSSTPNTTPASTSALDGASLVQERCSRCHPLARIESANHTAAEWQAIVNMMISRGAVLNSEEETAVVNYLSTNFGK